MNKFLLRTVVNDGASAFFLSLVFSILHEFQLYVIYYFIDIHTELQK